MKKTPCEILQEGKQLLSDPAKWAKGSLVKRADGTPTDLHDKKAFAFCVLGALHHVEGDYRNRRARDDAEYFVSQAVRPNGVGRDVDEWNDHPDRTHAEVMAVFDAAISMAQVKESA